VILREWHLERLRWLLSFSPVAAILGARQVGKTTLAKQLVASWEGPVTWFDLEAPEDLARLQEPMLALERLRGLVVLDEIQRMPGLFPLLRVLADREGEPARFLVLGSASPELVRGTSESLAGRIAFLELGGFSMRETGPESLEDLWVRGRLPRAFLAKSEEESVAWRRDLVRTFVERDLPQLGLRLPPVGLQRFWTMLAHLHGQILNTAALGRSMGVTAPVVRRYLDLMTGAFLVRQLQPWHENVGKRQVRRPKTYLADSGILHVLLGLAGRDELEGHPIVGASWEGSAMQEIIVLLDVRPEERFFWGLHSGAELDLLVVRGGRRLGFEIKRTTAPRVTRSMRTAMELLRLDSLHVIHAGKQAFPLAKGIEAVPLDRIYDHIAPGGSKPRGGPA